MNSTPDPALSHIHEPMASQGNLPLALVAGFVASIVGAVIWAAVTVATGYQLGLMAIGLGVLVGFAVGKLGRGVTPVYGCVGAAFSLLGCILGNFLSLLGFISIQKKVSYLEVFQSVDWSAIPSVMIETGSFMDLLFYAIAVYEGFKFSTRQ